MGEIALVFVPSLVRSIKRERIGCSSLLNLSSQFSPKTESAGADLWCNVMLKKSLSISVINSFDRGGMLLDLLVGIMYGVYCKRRCLDIASVS